MKLNKKVRNRILAEFHQFNNSRYKHITEPLCSCGKCVIIERNEVKKDIYILYSKGTKDLASIQMRLPQVAQYLLFYNPAIKIVLMSSRHSNLLSLKNKIVILTKFTADTISDSDLQMLIRRDNYVIVDPIDNSFNVNKFREAHVVLASSISQEKYFNETCSGKVKLIYHSSDLRLDGINSQKKYFSIGYFGNLHRIPAELLGISDLSIIKTPLSYEPKRQLPRYAKEMYKHPAHLVAGTLMPEFIFKPFTKGIIAEHVGSISLISKNDKEGILLLGQNYPYIAENNAKYSIIEMIEYMQVSFGSTEWVLARELHKILRPHTCKYFVTMSWQSLLNSI
jgi:hypothetical protein